MVHHSSATAIYWRDLGESVGNRPLETPDLGDTLRKSRSWFPFCPDYSIIPAVSHFQIDVSPCTVGWKCFFRKYFSCFHVSKFLTVVHNYTSVLHNVCFSNFSIVFSWCQLRLAIKSAEKYWKNIQAKVVQKFFIDERNLT